jgi:hypothetical protein
MRIWTEAAKAAQREAIKRWKPWAKSTGPKTAEGKQRASVNARKAGQVSIKSIRTLRAALQAQSRGLKAAKACAHWENAEKSEKRTIMMTYWRSVFMACNRTFLQGLIDWGNLETEDDRETWPVMSPEIKMAA